jgi:hypothetical protein
MTRSPFPPSSQVSDEGQPEGIPQMTRPPITPEQIEMMRAEAMRQAVEQVRGRNAPPPMQQPFQVAEPEPEIEPQVVYVRRNFTVAELILVLIMAIASVSLFQAVWGVVEPNLPRIEIKSR